ncbi:hypothetical protein DL95DRAFT_395102, partial [Leptodontidium sp. 2 PMI_412]
MLWNHESKQQTVVSLTAVCSTVTIASSASSKLSTQSPISKNHSLHILTTTKILASKQKRQMCVVQQKPHLISLDWPRRSCDLQQNRHACAFTETRDLRHATKDLRGMWR